jgi:hypothetical protein
MNETQKRKRPINPYFILLAAILLPGSGHVLLGLPQRGLQFLFFTVILGWVTTKFASPDVSFVGRHAAGVLIYAISIFDAYKLARIQFANWQYASGNTLQSDAVRQKDVGN